MLNPIKNAIDAGINIVKNKSEKDLKKFLNVEISSISRKLAAEETINPEIIPKINAPFAPFFKHKEIFFSLIKKLKPIPAIKILAIIGMISIYLK